jgi:hypothetical protein
MVANVLIGYNRPDDWPLGCNLVRLRRRHAHIQIFPAPAPLHLVHLLAVCWLGSVFSDPEHIELIRAKLDLN